MDPKDTYSKQDYQKILKKVEKESSQEKRQKMFNILKNEQHKNKIYQPRSYYRLAQRYFFQKRQDVTRYLKVKENKHTTIISVFLIFSTYLCWTIQHKYDMLKKRANRTRTYKEMQVERENQYIEKMLQKKQFQAVPIPDEIVQNNKYKYHQAQESDEHTMNTKQDLLNAIQEQTGIKGKHAQQKYEQQLHKQAQRRPI